MNSYEALYQKLRSIAGTGFVARQMLDSLELSDDELIDFLRLLESQGRLKDIQHGEDHEGKKFPSVFRLES